MHAEKEIRNNSQELETSETPHQGNHSNSSETTQCKFPGSSLVQKTEEKRPNRTGMPDKLQSGRKCISVYDLSPTRVHYNPAKLKQIGALAHIQDMNIYNGIVSKSIQKQDAKSESGSKEYRGKKQDFRLKNCGVKRNPVLNTFQFADKLTRKRCNQEDSFTQQEIVSCMEDRKTALSQRVIQRAEPNYDYEYSPEKIHKNNLDEWWDAMGGLEDENSRIQARSDMLFDMLPGIPFEQIKDVVSISTTGLEAWETLIIRTRNNVAGGEMRGATIPGRYRNWKIENDLGAGTEATVYNALSTSGKRRALKIFRGSDDLYEQTFEKELESHELLKVFESEGKPIPNVVKMLDSNSYIRAIIMERVDGVPVDKLEEHLVEENRYRKMLLQGGGSKIPVLNQLIDVPETMKKMRLSYKKALFETSEALKSRGLRLGDVQPRNTMYDYEKDNITFIDISLDEI